MSQGLEQASGAMDGPALEGIMKAYSCKPSMSKARKPKVVGTAHNKDMGFLSEMRKRKDTVGRGSSLEGEMSRRNMFGSQKPTRAERVAINAGVQWETIAKVRAMHKKKGIESRKYR